MNLREEIRQFRKRKIRFAIPILILGVLGLVLPIIPGMALIVLAVLLLFPLQGKKWIESIRAWYHKHMKQGATDQV